MPTAAAAAAVVLAALDARGAAQYRHAVLTKNDTNFLRAKASAGATKLRGPIGRGLHVRDD